MEAETKRCAYRLDPAGYVDRLRNAESERRVSVRPVPDVMARLSALLPVAQAVAAKVALERAADTVIAAGDARSRGQIMADTMIERITGRSTATDIPVEVCIVMTDVSLFGEALGAGVVGEAAAGDGLAAVDEPAELLGYGPVPAHWARALIARLGPDTAAWLRRLYQHPHTGQLVAMDSHRRFFGAGQRHFVAIRDHDTCRIPWCGAPLRHVDHVRAAATGGRTSVGNAEGLCEAHNHAKEAVGWSTEVTDQLRGTVTISTPTGHEYTHDPPFAPGEREGEDPSAADGCAPLRSVA